MKTRLVNRINNSKILFFVIHIIAFMIMVFWTWREPQRGDDFVFTYKGDDSNLMVFALNNAITYHMQWGGRSIVAFLRALLIKLDKWVYVVLNSGFYVWFVHIIYRFAYPDECGVNKKDSQTAHNYWLMFIYCLLWFFIPTYGDIVLWFTGSIAYLWPYTILLWYILLYHKRMLGYRDVRINSHIRTVVRCIGIAIIGFLAGSSVEPGACSLMVYLLFWIIYMKKKKNRIEMEDYVGGIAAICGFLFLFTAPGIWNRLTYTVGVEQESSGFLFRFLRVVYYSGKYMLIPFGVAIALLAVRGEFENVRSFVVREREQLICLSLAVISAFIMSFSPGFSYRVLLFPLACILMSAGISFRKHVEKESILVSFSMFLCSLILFTALTMFTAAIRCHQTGLPLEIETDYNDVQKNRANLF